MNEDKPYFKLDIDGSSIYCFSTWFSREYNLGYFYIVVVAELTNGTYISPPNFQGPFAKSVVEKIKSIIKVIKIDSTVYGSVMIRNFNNLIITPSSKTLEFVPFGITSFDFSLLAALGALSETLPDYGDYFGLKN